MAESRSFVVVGIEGTHGSGKTAVAHALVALLRQLGLGPTLVDDAGRSSPFVSDRLDGRDSGVPALLQELTLTATRIKAEGEAARHRGVVVCDKTVFGGLAYLRLFSADEADGPLFAATTGLCSAYAEQMYDLLILLDRRFDWQRDAVPDSGRYVDPNQQRRYQELVREELAASRVDLLIVTSTGDAWATANLILSEMRRRSLV